MGNKKLNYQHKFFILYNEDGMDLMREKVGTKSVPFLLFISKFLKLFLPPILFKLIKFLLHPIRGLSRIICMLDNTLLYRKIPDSFYLKCQFLLITNDKLNLNDPQNFNQKIQWLKIYYKNPLYTKLSDKYQVREYVENKIGNKYIIPLLGVWDKFEEISFDKLPNQFVLKCNHDCGSVVICKNKDAFDIEKAHLKIDSCLKINYSDNYPNREWQYKNIKPKIIAEQYMVNSTGEDTLDYKFFCFNGEPRVLYVSSIGEGEPEMNYYDLEWNKLSLTTGYEILQNKIERPNNLNEMLSISRELSKDLPFVRIDLYLVDGKIYFGEFTFTPSGGYYPFNPPEWNKIFGDWLKLPEKYIS